MNTSPEVGQINPSQLMAVFTDRGQFRCLLGASWCVGYELWALKVFIEGVGTLGDSG